MKNLYRINFYIDTGYEYTKKVAVVSADNEQSAVEKLHKWISPKLRGETFAELGSAIVNRIEENEFGIIYEDVFRKQED